MMKIQKYIESELRNIYSTDEARALAWWVLEELSGCSRTELLTRDVVLPEADVKEVLKRLLLHEPVQYVFGHTLWMGMDLHLTADTLIPRPETAELVEWVLRDNAGRSGVSVLDVGTGSGCIALALKKARQDWHVTAIDNSLGALRVAERNARANGLDVGFAYGDILKDKINACDLIVSNPPYIPLSDKDSMDKRVSSFEPQSALFVSDENPLVFYEVIARQKAAKALYLEINENMGERMETMLRNIGYTDVIMKKDMYGKQRMVRARLAE